MMKKVAQILGFFLCYFCANLPLTKYAASDIMGNSCHFDRKWHDQRF